MFDTVIYEKREGVAHLILNRPRVINAYNMQMRDDLYQLLEAVRDDPEVGAVILRGAGERGFCAGADLTEFGSAPSQAIARQVRWERDVWGLFLSTSKPLIAALHGFVLGSGVEMALLCDIRIASEDAIFGMPEVALGMIPAAGGTQTLPRAVGSAHALDVLLTNRRLNAQESLNLGLVNKVVARERLLREVGSIATYLSHQHSDALASAKEAVNIGMDLSLDEALKLEEHLALKLLYKRRTVQ
ncbi:MAG: enoyl-CoA hydratase/isomerase family protein [Chloroflexi bacterium]|nr:enoyl-CoA hydratase/isomerase family protein [Chloroflexota bacterium]